MDPSREIVLLNLCAHWFSGAASQKPRRRMCSWANALTFLLFVSMLLCWTSGAYGQINPPYQKMNTKVGTVRDGFQWILNVQGFGQYQPGVDHVFSYGGVPGDRPIAGNWSGASCGAGCFNAGIYRSSTQYFLLDANGDTMVGPAPGDRYFNLAIPSQATDIPVAGDWNGNGKSKVGLFRPSTCQWFLDYDGDELWNPAVDKQYQFGDCSQGDVPVVGDWVGAGRTRIGVYRHGLWILDTNGTGLIGGAMTFTFGGASDIPVPGGWFDQASYAGVLNQDYLWLLDTNGSQQFDPGQDVEVSYGSGTGSDIPVVGNWSRYVPPANATPDSLNVTVNGVNQGSNGSAAPATQAQLAFTFHDQVNGANNISFGQIYFANNNLDGILNCNVQWQRSLSGFMVFLLSNYGQSDSFCSIALASYTEDPNNLGALTITLNISFTAAALGSYTVNSLVYDRQFQSTGWGQAGTFAVTGPVTIKAEPPSPSVGLLNDDTYKVNFTVQNGNNYTFTVQSGSLPSGLTLSAAGVLSGKPTAEGTSTFTVAAMNSSGAVMGMVEHAVPIVAAPVTPVVSASFPSKEYIRLNNRVVAIEGGASQIQMASTKVGVFRDTQKAFLLDSDGNATYGAGVDRFMPNFILALPSGFVAGDRPIVGDWNGDGHWKVGIYRTSTGQWFLDLNNNGTYDAGDLTYSFGGLAGDVPFVGDWSNLGKSCIGIYRSNGSVWLLDLNCNGTFDNTPTDAFFPFGGLAGDIPVVGAWFGGKPHVGVVRKYAPGGIPQGNPFFWVLDAGEPNAGNSALNHQPAAFQCFAFGGLLGDVFVTGDWWNNGASAAGVYRNGLWALDAALPGGSQSSHNVPGLFFGYGGVPLDVPLTGKW